MSIAATIIAACLSACARQTESRGEATFVWLTPTAEGYEIRVDDEVVDIGELDEVVLRHALEANPGMSADDARENVRIYIGGRPGVSGVPPMSLDAHQEVLRALRGFKKIAIVGEDRRG